MNLTTATLVIVLGCPLALNPVKVPELSFEQRWVPVKQLPAPQETYERPLTFEERWEPVKRLPLMLLQDKSEELVPRVIPVRTITIRPVIPAVHVETAEQDVAEVPLPQPRPKIKPRPIRVADICTRHGMHKQVTRGGKSWRCRR